jgi:glycosyltransferase involved in cell wall biosynthesis
MKVLFVTSYGGVPGGISRWAGHIMKYYEAIGVKDCSITLVPMGRSSFVNINSASFYRLKEAIKDYTKILKDFKQKIRSEKHDVMHLTSSASWSLLKDIYMIKAAKRRGIKTVIHFRFGRIPDLAQVKNWEWTLIAMVLKLVDCAIVLDSKSLSVLKDLGYKNVVCMPNPVSPQVQAIVAQNKVERKPRYILFCGHVVKTKGVFELIDACSNIDDIYLKMVGHVTDEMRAAICDYSHNSAWLDLVGEIPYEQVIKEMMSSDIMVLPTYTEGFPNVILEGMAAGCAIIATNVGAIPQMLEEQNGEQYGVIIHPQDVKGLEDAINYLLDSPKEKEAMRVRVQSRVQERYSMEAIWNEMVSIWNGLIR